jgi:hypothetical protein
MASLDQLLDPEPYSPKRLVAHSSQPQDRSGVDKQATVVIAPTSSDGEGLMGDDKESMKATSKNRRHNQRASFKEKKLARRQHRAGAAKEEDMFSMFQWSTDEASDGSEVEEMRHEHALCRESSFRRKKSKEVCKPQRRLSEESDDLFEMFHWSKKQTAPPTMIHQQRKKHEEYLRSLSKDQLEPVRVNGWFRGSVRDFAFDPKAEGHPPPCLIDAGHDDDDDDDEPRSRSLAELGRRSQLAQERSKSINPVLIADNDPGKRVSSMDAIKQNYSAPQLMAYLDEGRAQNKNASCLAKQFSSGDKKPFFNVPKLKVFQRRNTDESIEQSLNLSLPGLSIASSSRSDTIGSSSSLLSQQ